MSIYRINGMAFYFDSMSDFMESIMKQDDNFIASLNNRLIVKEQNNMMTVLYHVEVDADNRVLRFIRPRRS